MTSDAKGAIDPQMPPEAEGFPNKYYPSELADREYRRVKLRREFVREGSTTGPTASEQASGGSSPKTGNDFIGLALSGGGIRSATFCLGVCQHLAETRLLRRFDFLSTVSGGGFFGGFLGAWIYRDGIDEVERQLEDSESAPVRFLRENGRYIAPNGSGDAGVALASYLRGWMAILLALGIVLFTVFVAGAAGESWAYTSTKLIRNDFTSFESRHFGLWLSLYWLVPYFVCVLWVVPLGGAFWLLGEKPLRLTPIVKLFVIVTALVVIAYGIKRPAGWPAVERADVTGIMGIGLLSLAAYFWKKSSDVDNVPRSALVTLLAVAAVMGAYYAFSGFHILWVPPEDQFSAALVIKQCISIAAPNANLPLEGHWLLWTAFVIVSYIWSFSYWCSAFTNNIDFVRRKLTELTALGLWAMLAFAVFAFVDTLGVTLAGKLQNDYGNWSTFKKLFTIGPTAVFSLVASVKLFMKNAGSLADKASTQTKTALLIGACAFALALTCGTSMSLLAHLTVSYCRVHDGGSIEALLIGLLILVFTIGRTTTLLNLSSDLQLYTARITRAYLGASNPIRQKSLEKQNVTQPVKGDDIPFDSYHPEDCGGPLHILNTTVNETIAGRSNLEQRDRHGFSMALGPEGISTGRVAHALFDRRDGALAGVRPGKFSFKVMLTQTKVVARRLWSKEVFVTPIQGPAFHPLSPDPQNPVRGKVEALSIGGWMGVSGAAFSTGLGQRTSRAYSFLAGFFNVRLGYWWNSHIVPAQRLGWSGERSQRRTVALGVGGWLGAAVSEVLSAPSYLIDELTARFHGPGARRLWNLSDGGHFENTSTYELIRRRVSFIVMCDCGADSDYKFEDLSNLVRKARIDLDAEITFLDQSKLKKALPLDLQALFGHPTEFVKDASGLCPYCAALARIEYFNEEAPVGWLLVIKPVLQGSEPLDIHDYALNSSTFPQESTIEQFFNEAQWESYRRLGRFIASKIFSEAPPVDAPAAGQVWRPITLSRA